MLLDEETFFENKQAIVGEVLEKLRGLAAMEANLLFREFESYGGSLPEVSQVISDCINLTTDVLCEALDTLSEEDRASLLPLFRAHLPKTLADLSFDHGKLFKCRPFCSFRPCEIPADHRSLLVLKCTRESLSSTFETR